MNQHIPLLLHLRVRLGLATACDRAEHQAACWQGLRPSSLSTLAVRGLKGLLPAGLAAAAILLMLGASKAGPRPDRPQDRENPPQVSVVRSYHLDVRIGDAHLQDDWQDPSGRSPDEALLDRLNHLASHWTSK